MTEEDWAMAIGNVHNKKFGKDHTWVPEISLQTDRHTMSVCVCMCTWNLWTQVEWTQLHHSLFSTYSIFSRHCFLYTISMTPAPSSLSVLCLFILMLLGRYSNGLVVQGLCQHVDQQGNRLELHEDLDVLHVLHQVQLLLLMVQPLCWVS